MELTTFIITMISSIIDSYFHPTKRGRPKKTNNDYIIKMIFKVLRTGMQWRELNSRLLSPKTINNYFNKWTNKGVFKKAYVNILNLYYQTKNKAIEYYVICESATQIHLTLGAPLSA